MDVPFFKNATSSTLSFFSKKNKSVLGVDIGASSVKLVQLRMENERAVLETYGELATGPYADKSVGQSVRLADKRAEEIIADLAHETGATAKDAIVGIPLRNSFVTSVEIPNMREEDIGTVMQYEARRYIPVPLSEVIMDWWRIPDTADRKDSSIATPAEKVTHVLLVAVPKDVVEKYQHIVEETGLQVRAFEVEVFSTIRAIIGHERAGTLLVDFGASTTKMAILEEGIIRLSHSFDRGFQDISHALAESLGIGFERAELLKRDTGISLRAEHKGMTSVIMPLVDFMLIEMERFAVGFTRKYRGTISKIYITGGGSLMPGLSDYIVKKFGVEVLLGSPFSKVEYPAFFQPVLKEIGPSFSVAVGLALRGLK